jgi:hypothetical protein
MKRIVELGDGGQVYARYNTNLSRVDFRGVNLYRDILDHVRDWQICASIDGTGATGEYIRTGLDYSQFRRNFEQGLQHQRNRRQMRLDFTLTLPGLFEVNNIQSLAQEYDVELLTKVIFSFSPDIVLSPLALPRDLLHSKLDQLIELSTTASMKDLLTQLKTRPTFAEQWPDTYQAELSKGKARVLQLEHIRRDTYTMSDILSQDKEMHEWWKSIA